MTFAFGMNDLFKEVYRNGRAPLRFAVMEKASGPKRTAEAREEEEEKIRQLRFDEAESNLSQAMELFGKLDHHASQANARSHGRGAWVMGRPAPRPTR